MKFSDVRHNEGLLRKDRKLWQTIANGIGEATIFIVDPAPFAAGILRWYDNQQADYGYDYKWKDVLGQAAVDIVANSPVYMYSNDAAAPSAAIQGAPLLYAPHNFVPSPPTLLRAVGGKLRDAVTFAGRAYAAIDDPSRETGTEVFVPFGILGAPTGVVTRVFDKEHARSTAVLNNVITTAESAQRGFFIQCGSAVVEMDSRAVDGLQAADVAAGYAREVLEQEGLRALAARFQRVVVNGVDVALVVR